MGERKKKPVEKRQMGKAPQGKLYKIDSGNHSNIVEESQPAIFTIVRGGKPKEYKVDASYGYFVVSFRRATSIQKISEVVDTGVASKEIAPLIKYLDLKIPQIAKAASVSASTVSRWLPNTSIGVAGTSQFFKIDEVVRKGIDIFGGEEEFRGWLNSPNMALGNQIPSEILTSQIGVELVDEALDALHFGTVL